MLKLHHSTDNNVAAFLSSLCFCWHKVYKVYKDCYANSNVPLTLTPDKFRVRFNDHIVLFMYWWDSALWVIHHLCAACPVTCYIIILADTHQWSPTLQAVVPEFQELSDFSAIKVIITAWHAILDWTIHHYVKFSTESVTQCYNYWLITQFVKNNSP